MRLPVTSTAAVLSLAALLMGCTAPGGSASATSAASATPGVLVVKSRGSLQCDASAGTPPAAMSAQLEAAGIAVRRSGCATDGRLHPARCGAPTGELNLFEIAAADLPKAEAQGFARLSGLRSDPASPPREVPCR